MHASVATRRLLAAFIVANLPPLLSAQDSFHQQSAPNQPPSATQPLVPDASSLTITLDLIMSDPEWLGRAPESPYWADDSASVYYRRQRTGSKVSDWFEADLQGNLKRIIADDERYSRDADEGILSPNRQLKAFERNGDLFVKDLRTSRVRQLTRTHSRESSPSFMADGRRLMFRREGTVLARHLNNGLEQELVNIRMEKDPEDSAAQKASFLTEQQQRLFDVLREEKEDREELRNAAKEEAQADRTRVAQPWYLGDQHRLENVAVSPNGRWCLVVLAAKTATDGVSDKMPEFIDESGYVTIRNVRSLVGTSRPASDQLMLLDLAKRTKVELSMDNLPDINTDRLTEVRESGKQWLADRKAKAIESTDDSGDTPDGEGKREADANDANNEVAEGNKSSKQSRTVQAWGIEWNAAGDQVVVQLFADDNKDRWLASVDLKSKKLNCLSHQYDPAWINRGIARVGWLDDDQSLYYLSEETGYAHLYVAHVPSQSSRQLTRGAFVVSDVRLGPDGKNLYYQANAEHPGIYEIYRVDVGSAAIEQLTSLGGMNDYQLSPDGKRLLITHSTALRPPELWIQAIADGDPPRQITETVSTEFVTLPWIEPIFVTVPSRDGVPIHARLYLPPGAADDDENERPKRPAVIFIHGAGYLQNAHQGWSSYFREFMFHSLLAHHGYVVLDMDYRASAGYGRDWRTAIYRHMGGPEVEDLLDGRQWLGEEHHVDIDRVGLYGGSYGGFLTMMALFQHPGSFACGAALRPVTDWAHYNHGYTSNILNTPDVDPEAYYRSSPIELADGLADPLLICHGMVDDNVFFKDTARLAQRFIELKKDEWEVAIYPVESHGFVQPSSWYDEYRRIFELFQKHLTNGK